jgi:tetratricopeptide (TPR) repeat protein
MEDIGKVSDEKLLRRGRDALWLDKYPEAAQVLALYCSRLKQRGHPVPPTILAYYGLAVGHARNVREGLKLCLEALSADRRNPTIYLCLARLYVLSGSRKNAIEILAQGIRVRPNHRGLNMLREELGVRQRRPIPFLPRESAFNVHLGRFLRKVKKKRTPIQAVL